MTALAKRNEFIPGIKEINAKIWRAFDSNERPKRKSRPLKEREREGEKGELECYCMRHKQNGQLG